MINHARTLLLNINRRRMHASDVGYEYIPPEFKPVQLSPTLNLVHQTLFGSAPDNYFLSYRARELLGYIHTTELVKYVYAFDPRVTYWPETSRQFFEPTSKRVAITQTYGAPHRFSVLGNLRSLNAIGSAYNQFTIDFFKDDDNALKLKLQRVHGREPAIVETVSSLSVPTLTLPNTEVKLKLALRVPLPGHPEIMSERANSLSVEPYTTPGGGDIYLERPAINRVLSDDAALTVIETYSAIPPQVQTNLLARWFVETRATPDPVLTTAISALEMMGEPASLELFGFDNKEPYLTFKNLWFDHPLPTYRLSGIVLALIYRIQELRG